MMETPIPLEEQTPGQVTSSSLHCGQPSRQGDDGPCVEYPDPEPWQAVSNEMRHVEPMDTDDQSMNDQYLAQEGNGTPVTNSTISSIGWSDSNPNNAKPDYRVDPTYAVQCEPSGCPSDSLNWQQNDFAGRQERNDTATYLAPPLPAILPSKIKHHIRQRSDGILAREESPDASGDILEEAARQAGLPTYNKVEVSMPIKGHQPIGGFSLKELRKLCPELARRLVYGEKAVKQPHAIWEELRANVLEEDKWLIVDPNKTVKNAKPHKSIVSLQAVFLASRVPHHKDCECLQFEPNKNLPSKHMSTLRPIRPASDPTTMASGTPADNVDGIHRAMSATPIKHSEQEQRWSEHNASLPPHLACYPQSHYRMSNLTVQVLRKADIDQTGKNTDVPQQASPTTEQLNIDNVAEGGRSSSDTAALHQDHLPDQIMLPRAVFLANQPAQRVGNTASSNMGGNVLRIMPRQQRSLSTAGSAALPAYLSTAPTSVPTNYLNKEGEKTVLPSNVLSGVYPPAPAMNHPLTAPQTVTAGTTFSMSAASLPAADHAGTPHSFISTTLDADHQMSFWNECFEDCMASLATAPKLEHWDSSDFEKELEKRYPRTMSIITANRTW